ncbi:transcriptional regulator [Sphingomonas sp. LT1P40]|uniref:transcriptional regulator n=1 Tax=Alteristakelama amylovorans TaxID=3096166 RepID=UPI002FCBE885
MAKVTTPFDALNEAIEVAGSQSALARTCGVSQQAVAKWVASRKAIPADYVLRVEAATGVLRHALRPDIYPHDAETAAPPSPGVVTSGAPVVACDRSALLHQGSLL